jgi:hypothetical protein
MPAGVGCLTRPAWGCLGYRIFILGAVPEARSHSFVTHITRFYLKPNLKFEQNVSMTYLRWKIAQMRHLCYTWFNFTTCR